VREQVMGGGTLHTPEPLHRPAGCSVPSGAQLDGEQVVDAL